MNVFQGFVLITCVILGGATVLGITLVTTLGKKNSNNTNLFQRRERYTPKMKISPKAALCEPGICQCDDALAYHAGSGKCNVPGCPCQQFIPSDLNADEMKDVANAQVTRLAIESVNVRMDLETKTRALEAATHDRMVRNEMAQRQSIDSGFGFVEEETVGSSSRRRR